MNGRGIARTTAELVPVNPKHCADDLFDLGEGGFSLAEVAFLTPQEGVHDLQGVVSLPAGVDESEGTGAPGDVVDYGIPELAKGVDDFLGGLRREIRHGEPFDAVQWCLAQAEVAR